MQVSGQQVLCTMPSASDKSVPMGGALIREGTNEGLDEEGAIEPQGRSRPAGHKRWSNASGASSVGIGMRCAPRG